MKLKKKDFGKWDKEELSIIVKGYTAKQIADHILENQQIVDKLKRNTEGNMTSIKKEETNEELANQILTIIVNLIIDHPSTFDIDEMNEVCELAYRIHDKYVIGE